MCSFSVAYAWTAISFDQSLREKSSLIGVDIYIYICDGGAMMLMKRRLHRPLCLHKSCDTNLST